jgi:hypothetical protein
LLLRGFGTLSRLDSNAGFVAVAYIDFQVFIAVSILKFGRFADTPGGWVLIAKSMICGSSIESHLIYSQKLHQFSFQSFTRLHIAQSDQ